MSTENETQTQEYDVERALDQFARLPDEGMIVGEAIYQRIDAFERALQEGDRTALRLLMAIRICLREEDVESLQAEADAATTALEKLMERDLWRLDSDFAERADNLLGELREWKSDDGLLGLISHMLLELNKFDRRGDYSDRSKRINNTKLDAYGASIREMLSIDLNQMREGEADQSAVSQEAAL